MKIKYLFLSFFIFLSSPLQAEGPVLLVGVDNFAPPFVIRGANSQLYGFDIAMMEFVCKEVRRTCQYKPMPFSQLLDSVQQGKVEVGLAAFTITRERLAKVNFSQPYLLSQARFLARTELTNGDFQLSLLNDHKIGVEQGTIFPDLITSLGVKNPEIIVFDKTDDMIEAIYEGSIDFALMDAPSALYWQSQTSGVVRVYGNPFTYGFGLGIAVNRGSMTLLQEINSALQKFAVSKDYKLAYQKYIESF